MKLLPHGGHRNRFPVGRFFVGEGLHDTVPDLAAVDGHVLGRFNTQAHLRSADFQHRHDDVVANLIVAQLLYLSQDDPDREIQMYINSPGGQVDAGLAIYDTMHLIQPAVATTCIGMAASMGAVLLGGGSKGKRSALPNSRILIHQASAGFQGTAADIEVQAREIIRINARLQEMMAADTGQPVDRVSHDINRDYWMSAHEARDYGIIDTIVGQTDATAAADRAEAAVQRESSDPSLRPTNGKTA
jgi:ATP-dependent Clp protease, protease subunit